MKYKITGLAACLLILLAVVILPTLLHPKEKIERYVQHEEATLRAEDEPEDNTLEDFATHLPVVEIDTEGEKIPGRNIYNAKGKTVGHTKTKDGEETLLANMRIVDHQDECNQYGDEAELESQIRIRIRGKSSRRFPKKGYAIKLVDEKGKANPQEVCGMEAHQDWVLHGPFLDKTLLRNYMWYNLAGQLMDYAPNCRYTEVYLNGEYQGVYLMVEKITGGKKNERLKLSVDTKYNTMTGYLIRLDRGSSNPIANIDTFLNYTYKDEGEYDIEYPGSKNLDEELAEEIRQEFNQFTKTLYSYDYADPKYGYPSLLDTDSFVDYFLINEITYNSDAGEYSTYIYKQPGEKYKMCVWDFNNALNNYQETEFATSGFFLQNASYFNMLVRDADFCEQVVERYRQLRKGILSDRALQKFIDDTNEYLGPAIERNNERWSYAWKEKWYNQASRNGRSYEESLEDMETYLFDRLDWMDQNIESLKQYGANSKVKNYKTDAE